MISRIARATKFVAAVAAAAMIPALALAQADAQTDEQSRLHEMESKLLGTATPAGPVPGDEEVQVTLLLKRGTPLSPDTLNGSHVERLTARQYADRYSAGAETQAKIDAFARANHLRVVESDPVKRRVVLAGSAAAISAAFSTQLHRFSLANGQLFRATTTPPTLPPDLAANVEGVVGLNTRPILSPRFMKSHATAVQQGHVEAVQIASFYNFPNDVNGAGQTIAIIQFGGGFKQEDLDAYFASLKLPTPNINVVSVGNSKNSPGTDADTEVALDIEVAGSVANGASIVVYFAQGDEQGFLNSILDAVHSQQQTPSVISISWGGAEDMWDAQGLAALNSVLLDAATLGVTVVAASGDDGSSDNMTDKKLHVDFPASSPYVLAVGGTTLALKNNAISSETVWNNGRGATGGGVSLAFPRPAYQSLAKVPTHPATGFAGRGVPDVAGSADPDVGYRIHLNGKDIVVGGTSAAAPLWAALIARLDQKIGRPLGFINDKLYGAGPRMFHAISGGGNDLTGLGAYGAVPGWNACTGLGTPDAAEILANLGIDFGATAASATQSTLLVAFGDTTDKVRSLYPIAGTPTNGCGAPQSCVTLTAPSLGLMFFFNPASNLLYEIRADAPFAGSIDGVHIGDALHDVIALLGKPIADPHHYNDADAYVFKSRTGLVRCDFDKNKKCRTIFIEQ